MKNVQINLIKRTMSVLLVLAILAGMLSFVCVSASASGTESEQVAEAPTTVTEVNTDVNTEVNTEDTTQESTVYIDCQGTTLSLANIDEIYPNDGEFVLHFELMAEPGIEIASYSYEVDGLTVLSAQQNNDFIDFTLLRITDAEQVRITVNAILNNGEERQGDAFGVTYPEGLFIVRTGYTFTYDAYLSYCYLHGLITRKEYDQMLRDHWSTGVTETIIVTSNAPTTTQDTTSTNRTIKLHSNFWMWCWLAIFSIVCVIAKYLFIFLRRRKRKERQ
jgi:hypothetical protein